ncbi:MAG: copper amine oxidase N-terminal domain-containing protein, partial [Bacillota bacterium]|nr:copper amine oxidase N-terminal domain-containing protein [Bacillota bacterium]
DAAPTIFEGRTVLPIKYVAEPLGAAVGWDPETRRVRITHQTWVIDLWIGQNRAAVNGSGEMIDPNNANVTPVVLPPGRTMLPLKFIAQQLGAQVEWDPVQRRVTITYPAP